MVMDEYTSTWLKTEDFAGNKQIIALVEDAKIELSNNGKKETVFELLLPNGDLRKLSVWGTNKQNVAKAIGNGKTYDTDAIKGRSVMLTVEKFVTKEGKDIYKKVLHVVPR